MGVVYLAEHPVIGKKVAMKAIHPELSKNSDVVSRFVTEAKAVNQIGHEHIVDIADFGNTPEGEFYFVMEYLQGESLSDRLRRENRLNAGSALSITAQIADALNASHEQGIIHRDLKPENIFLSKQGGIVDYPKVLDFGLAKVTERQMQPGSVILTQEGMVFGTPEFMSPEQAQGRILDARSDIYSLAVILYEVLTGKLPFSARTPMEYIQKHVMEPAIPLNERVPERKFPKGLEDVLARALKKKPDERFQSAAEFGEALRPYGGAAAAALPVIRVAGPQVVVETNHAAPDAPASAGSGSSGLGLLIGVAVACLLGGVIIAIIVMRAVGR